MKRWIRSTSRALALIITLCVLAGVVYEKLGQQRDRTRFPRVGRSVDIGGRSLNIDCSGEGLPAVILDTGGSAPGYSNLHLQARISRLTRTCWFDRAGLGWSDPSPVQQTSSAIAHDLHALLHAAGIPPPYILVGASFSGFNVRVFAGKYPGEVSGMVLVDSVQEDQQQYEPRASLAPVNRLPASVRGLLCRTVPVTGKIGLLRLLLNAHGGRRETPPGFTQSEAAILQELERQPKSFVAASGCGNWEKSAAEAHVVGSLGECPLIVLTAGKPFITGDPEADKELAAFHEIWVHQLQVKLSRLSTRGRQVIVESSGHGIGEEAPEAVIDAISQLLSAVRRE